MINLKNIQFLFFSICIVSFWIMYFVYSFFNRLATDDYSMIALANDKDEKTKDDVDLLETDSDDTIDDLEYEGA